LKTKVVLFGSNGKIGKSIKRLFKKEFELFSVDLTKDRKKSEKNFFNLDLSKKVNLKKLGNINADVAIILSFYKSMPRDFLNEKKSNFFLINNNILNNCIRICKKLKVKKIIYFSSAAVYKNNKSKKKIKESFRIEANNVYSKFKILAEKKIENYSNKYNLKFIILRLFNIFDNKGNDLINNFKAQMRSKKNININGDGYQSRDFLHISDIFSVLKKLINNEYGNQILNLCSGRPLSIRSIINKINKKKVKFTFNKKLKTNYFLVGDNGKIKKLTNWKIKKNFKLSLEK
tara:strand:- start:1581 stop:2447 length:867 start_codon:yes stop_codon:yes gene_type:complete